MTDPAANAKPGRGRAELALAAVALIWGATFVLVKNALADISPALFLGLRFSLAAVALGFLYLAKRRRSGPRRPIRGGAITGCFLFIGYLLQTTGLRFTTPSKSAFITGFYIVLVPFFTAAVYWRVPEISEVAGVVAATAGLGLLTLNHLNFEVGFGDLLTIGCAIAFAIHIIVLGHYSQRVDYEWLTLVQIGTCAAIALSTFWWMEAPVIRWSRSVWMALAVTALLATALAFSVQTWAQQFTTPTRTALIFSLEPVFAWVTSFLLANEVLSGRSLAGAALILAGILLVELKPIRRRTHHLSS